MQVSIGRIVLYTYRRWADHEPVTRPAMVSDVVEAQRNKAPDPTRPRGQRERESVPAVKLVVFDETGVRPLDHPVFEDAVCEDGKPALGCWGWPPRSDAAAPAAAKPNAKGKR